MARTTPTSATAEPTDTSKLRVTMSITALIAARLTMVRLQREQAQVALGQEQPVGEELERRARSTASTSSSV